MNLLKIDTDKDYNKLTYEQKNNRANKFYNLVRKYDELEIKGKYKVAEKIWDFINVKMLWQDITHMNIKQASLVNACELCEDLTEYFSIDELIDAGVLIDTSDY